MASIIDFKGVHMQDYSFQETLLLLFIIKYHFY